MHTRIKKYNLISIFKKWFIFILILPTLKFHFTVKTGYFGARGAECVDRHPVRTLLPLLVDVGLLTHINSLLVLDD